MRSKASCRHVPRCACFFSCSGRGDARLAVRCGWRYCMHGLPPRVAQCGSLRTAQSLTNGNAAGEHTAASRCAEQRQASWPEAKTIERLINWSVNIRGAIRAIRFASRQRGTGTRFPFSFNAHGIREFLECCTFVLSNRYCIPGQFRMRQACVRLDGEHCAYGAGKGAVKNRTCPSFAHNEHKYGRRHPDTNPEETVAKSEHLEKRMPTPQKK